MKGSTKVRIHVMIDPHYLKKIDKLAVKEDRSRSNMIEQCIQREANRQDVR